MSEPLRVAVVGAGPAGIYAADILCKNDPDLTVDIYDRLPTPYGLIRYGVAPDHPRIKQIIVALHQVMESDRIQFFGNVHVGVDVKVDELRQFYDAIIFATGAERDRSLDVPGIDLAGSYGAADFVAFYDSHPDREQTWDLTQAASVAVIGVGNVGLDVARMLARTGDELLYTEIPDHVHRVLAGVGRHRRAHVRPARPGAGQVHPGGAARAGPLAQRPGRGGARGHGVRPGLPAGDRQGQVAADGGRRALRVGHARARSQVRTGGSTSTSWRTRSRCSARTAGSSGCAPSGWN